MKRFSIISALTLCFAIFTFCNVAAGKPDKPGKPGGGGKPAVAYDTQIVGDLTGNGVMNGVGVDKYSPFTLTFSGNLPAGTHDGMLAIDPGKTKGPRKTRIWFKYGDLILAACEGVLTKDNGILTLTFTNAKTLIAEPDNTVILQTTSSFTVILTEQ